MTWYIDPKSRESRLYWGALRNREGNRRALDLVLDRPLRHRLVGQYNSPDLKRSDGEPYIHADKLHLRVVPWKGQGLFPFSFYLSPEVLDNFLGEAPRRTWDQTAWGRRARGAALALPGGQLIPTEAKGLPEELSQERIRAIKKLLPQTEQVRQHRDASGVVVRQLWREEEQNIEVRVCPLPRLDGALPTVDSDHRFGLGLFSVPTGPVAGYPGVVLFLSRGFLKSWLGLVPRERLRRGFHQGQRKQGEVDGAC